MPTSSFQQSLRIWLQFSQSDSRSHIFFLMVHFPYFTYFPFLQFFKISLELLLNRFLCGKVFLCYILIIFMAILEFYQLFKQELFRFMNGGTAAWTTLFGDARKKLQYLKMKSMFVPTPASRSVLQLHFKAQWKYS